MRCSESSPVISKSQRIPAPPSQGCGGWESPGKCLQTASSRPCLKLAYTLLFLVLHGSQTESLPRSTPSKCLRNVTNLTSATAVSRERYFSFAVTPTVVEGLLSARSGPISLLTFQNRKRHGRSCGFRPDACCSQSSITVRTLGEG